MPIIDERAVVLAEVPVLQEDAPIGTNILIENEGTIQRYNIKTKILDKISEVNNTIGHKSDDVTEATGIFLELENTNARIDEMDDNIGIPSGGGNAEGATGIYKRIESLEADNTILNSKSLVEGYRIRFINQSNKINLLSADSRTYNFPDVKENIANCLGNSQNYEINLHFHMVYELKNTTYGKLGARATINLNSVYSTGTSKKGIIYVPIANSNLIFKFNIEKNKITFNLENKINIDEIKSEEITVEHAVLEFNKLTANV